LSSPFGDLALTNEGPSLDSCFGHSAPGGAYHYHANINCSDAGAATGASDADACVHLGYMNDGVPIYGFCKDSRGKQFSSCYSLNDGVSTKTVSTVGGTFGDLGENESNYSYDQASFSSGECNLDEASGAIHPGTGKYSYFMVSSYPWVPIKFFGNEGAGTLCSAM